ncbi:MAG: thiamine pyrophosphate-dependent enzyme [Actinomycetota bacterium]|nr:thiamine pyrophosphate-dependent enzyme [Actinomycetota bacterium]
MALGAKLDKQSLKVFAVVGDGECEEGQIWEAAMAAAHDKLYLCICIRAIDGFTTDIMNSEPLADKWKAFGWEVIEIDGHDLDQIEQAVKKSHGYEGQTELLQQLTDNGQRKRRRFYGRPGAKWHGQGPI